MDWKKFGKIISRLDDRRKNFSHHGKNIIEISLLATTLIFSPFYTQNIQAKEEPSRIKQTANHSSKKKSKAKKSPLKIGYSLDCLWSVPLYEVTVPGKYVPARPDFPDHKISTLGGGGISFGPKLELFSIIGVGIKYNLANFKNCDSYETYWGGYGTGQYACIGSVITKQEPFNYDLSIQTPHINLNEDIGVRAFYSYVRRDFDLHYKSGYHKYGKAFYEVVDYFKIGEFDSEGFRYGIKISLFKEEKDWLISFFYQNSSVDGSLTERGEEFKYDSTQSFIGWVFEGTF